MKITRKFIRESNLYTEVSNYLYNIFASPQNILSDEVILDDFQVRHLKEVLESYPLVKDLFIEEGIIEEEDRNPFKKDLSCEDIDNLDIVLDNVLHNIFEGQAMSVTYGAENNILTGERRDLRRRSLYVGAGYEVLLHTTRFDGTIIELRKR